jgi:hypothetical protein
MEVIGKILMTISGILALLFIWVEIKSVKFKDFLEKVKQALSDGKVTQEEAFELILAFWNLFKPDPEVPEA